jgi:hypothetical protein
MFIARAEDGLGLKIAAQVTPEPTGEDLAFVKQRSTFAT